MVAAVFRAVRDDRGLKLGANGSPAEPDLIVGRDRAGLHATITAWRLGGRSVLRRFLGRLVGFDRFIGPGSGFFRDIGSLAGVCWFCIGRHEIGISELAALRHSFAASRLRSAPHGRDRDGFPELRANRWCFGDRAVAQGELARGPVRSFGRSGMIKRALRS